MSVPALVLTEFPSEDELRPPVDPATGIDLNLISLNLQMSMEERWEANDAALNFVADLRNAVTKHYHGQP